MGRRATGWEWTKVGVLHGGLSRREVACDGEIRSYRYRFYSSTHRFFERCIGLAWCSRCREYSGAMVHVSRAEQLTDLLDGLPVAERERLLRSEAELLDYLDRLARRGRWPDPPVDIGLRDARFSAQG
ncbi:hypothetical protein [Catenuloplanes japonicus]|uniref:hypothetical protein n=1 Tax=Catenuloplanes japonicus TaxID=33876 RepID=UPI0005278FF5|nr:hypothetical protein [Catenuloplanes japonicus]